MDLADGYGITRYALFLLSPLLSCIRLASLHVETDEFERAT